MQRIKNLLVVALGILPVVGLAKGAYKTGAVAEIKNVSIEKCSQYAGTDYTSICYLSIELEEPGGVSTCYGAMSYSYIYGDEKKENSQTFSGHAVAQYGEAEVEFEFAAGALTAEVEWIECRELLPAD